jgi:hypothetical protein
MKKIILRICFIVLLICLANIPAFSQKPLTSGAKISFSETMWDFGYVPKTGTVSHTYIIKNTGSDTLIIVKVRPDCGCTTTPMTQKRLSPNEAAEMKIFFDPRKVVTTEVVKKLQIISNDPDNPISEAQFTAKIGITSSLVKLSPIEFNFDTLTLGAEGSRTITVENISKEQLSINVIESPVDYVDYSIGNKVIKPGESIQLVVKLKRGVASGNFHTSLTLEFEGSKVARISIPIFGEIISQ